MHYLNNRRSSDFDKQGGNQQPQYEVVPKQSIFNIIRARYLDEYKIGSSPTLVAYIQRTDDTSRSGKDSSNSNDLEIGGQSNIPKVGLTFITPQEKRLPKKG